MQLSLGASNDEVVENKTDKLIAIKSGSKRSVISPAHRNIDDDSINTSSHSRVSHRTKGKHKKEK
jgi:hypothetical protein